MLKRIAPYVAEALTKAEEEPERIVSVLPFPAHGHQREYVEALKTILAGTASQDLGLERQG
jgi:hypothetical protein